MIASSISYLKCNKDVRSFVVVCDGTEVNTGSIGGVILLL